MLSLELIPERPAFSPGEALAVQFRIANHGSQPVDLPHPDRIGNRQPTYTISGPGFPTPKTFSLASLLTERGKQDRVARAQPVTIQIAPHSTWEEPFEGLEILGLALEGDYQLSFSYQLPTGAVQSPPAVFRIGRFMAEDVVSGQGTLPGQGLGIYIVPTGQQRSLYSCMFTETRADIGEAKPISIRFRRSVPLDANDFLVASKNLPYEAEEETSDWVVWRESRTLKVDSAYMETPASFDLGLEVAYLARPMLKPEGAPFEILAVSKDQRQLVLATLGYDQDGRAKDFAVAWRHPLPERPVHLTLALASPREPERRDVAFASTRAEGIAVYHGSYTRGSGLGALQVSILKDVRLLRSFPLSLWIDPDNGHAQVSLLVAGPGSNPLSLVDLDYEQPGATPVGPSVFKFRSFPGTPVSGGVFYANPKRGVKRKVIVVVNDKQEIYATAHLGKLVHQPFSVAPAQPLAVLAGKNKDYLLCTHPNRGLILEPISLQGE